MVFCPRPPGALLPLAACLGLVSACLGPNPNYVEDEVGGTSTQDAESSDTTTETTDTDTTATETTETTATETSGDTCANGVLDGDETDVDCGGSCGPCGDGAACVEGSDCASAVCEDMSCQSASCMDAALNQGELEIDCGGPCALCPASELLEELDDYEAANASLPEVAMFDDGHFAVSFTDQTSAVRVRWFDAAGLPLASGEDHAAALTHDPPRSAPLAAGDAESSQLQVLVSAADAMTQGERECFFSPHHPGADGVAQRLADGSSDSQGGDIIVDGSKVTVVWQAEEQVWLRRWDDEIGGGTWTDIAALPAETEPASYTVNAAALPRISKGPDGVDVVAWIRCALPGGTTCQAVARRIDEDWLDAAPRVLSEDAVYLAAIEISRGVGGKSAATWIVLNGPDSILAQARILDADLNSEGPVFDLTPFQGVSPRPSVQALSDGSFAFAWIDNGISGVRLQRFTAAGEPLIPGLAEEASWPGLDSIGTVSLSASDGRLVVVWATYVEGLNQIQGQLFAF